MLDPPGSSYLTLDQIAGEFHVAKKTALRRIREGKFPPHVRIGRVFLWRRSTVESWLAARESPTGIAPRRRTRRNGQVV